MAGNEVKIILTAVDKASAVLDKAGKNVKQSSVNWGAAFSAVGVGAAVAFGAVTKFVGDAVKSTVLYADQVRDLGRLIGASAEESSKLIQAADDVFVSYEELTAGMRVAIRKGIEPSIEGMGRLADEYLAIQDPIARSKFLMDTFGRAGAKLAPLLEKGSEGIKELGENAEAAGLVMDKEGVDSALRYKESLDALNDSFMGLKITIGQAALPALTAFATNTNDLLQYIEKEGIQGFVTWNEKWAELARTSVKFGVSIDDLTIGMTEQDIQARILEGSMLGVGQATDAAAIASKKVKDAQDELNNSMGNGASAFALAASELRTANIATERKIYLDKQLKILSGEVTKEQQEMALAINFLTNHLEAGSITQQQYLDLVSALGSGAISASGGVTALKRAIDALQNKTVTINVNAKFSASYLKFLESHKQHGGPVAAGMPYIVGEAGPELFIPRQGGKIVPNNRLTGSGGTGAGGGGDILIGDINIFASPGMNEEQLARLVIARLSAAARHSGYAGLDYAG